MSHLGVPRLICTQSAEKVSTSDNKYTGIGHDCSPCETASDNKLPSIQLTPLSLTQAQTIEELFNNRFEQTKIKEYGILETFTFSVIKPIKLMLNDLLGGKLGTRFSEAEAEELQNYRQNQAFYKQIVKMQTAHNNYQSAIKKSMTATPEKAAAAATAEYDRAKELKDAYEELLNLAIDQTKTLAEVDAKKFKIVSDNESGEEGEKTYDSNSNDVDNDNDHGNGYDSNSDDNVSCPTIAINPENIECLNTLRRQELFKTLSLKSPNIMSSIYMAESMLSVVEKVDGAVKYDQEKLLDFMDHFDEKVEELLMQRAAEDDGDVDRTLVEEGLMRGLVGANGLGTLESIDVLAGIEKTRHPNGVDNKTIEKMMDHFAKALNELSNVPVDCEPMNLEEFNQEMMELRKAVERINFQGLSLTSLYKNPDQLINNIQLMRQAAYELQGKQKKEKTSIDESKRLNKLIENTTAQMNESIEFTIEELNAFIPRISFSLPTTTTPPPSCASVQEKVSSLRKLKAEVDRQTELKTNAIHAKARAKDEAEKALQKLKNSQKEDRKLFDSLAEEADNKRKERKELVSASKKLTKELTKLASHKGVASVGINVESSLESIAFPKLTEANEAIKTIEEKSKALWNGIDGRESEIDKAAAALKILEAELGTLERENEDNNSPDLMKAVAAYDAAKAEKIKLTGKDLLAIDQHIPDCSGVGAVADILDLAKANASILKKLKDAYQEEQEKQGLWHCELIIFRKSFENGPVNLEQGKLVIVPKKFFTENEKSNMGQRLANSRSRTAELTYKLSKKILMQDKSKIECRPYIKDQTARERNATTAALAGGLAYNGKRMEEIFQSIQLSQSPEGTLRSSFEGEYDGAEGNDVNEVSNNATSKIEVVVDDEEV